MRRSFDKLRQEEQKRCFASIQPLLALKEKDVTGKRIAEEARKQKIHTSLLTKRYHNYLAKGQDSLYPVSWKEPSRETWDIIQTRMMQLGTEANKLYLTNKDIEKVAKRNDWSWQKAARLLKQYREGGWIAFDPTKRTRGRKSTAKKRLAWGLTDRSAAQGAYAKFSLIEPLLELTENITQAVRKRAIEVGVSEKTVWNGLRDYKEGEFEALTRKKREDAGEYRGITQEAVNLTKKIRLANSNWSAVAVQEEVERILSGTGETPPSENQVRKIIKTIPLEMLALADGRTGEFTNTYQVVGHQPKPKDRVIWQIDDTPAPWMLLDLRPKTIRNESGQFRPTYASVIDTRSSFSLANHLWYDAPNKDTAAVLIRDAILIGGLPHEIQMDSGRYFLASHVLEFLKTLKIKFVHRKHQPQQNGSIESWWLKVEKELFSREKGYTGPDIKRRNRNIEVKYDIYDADQILKQYVAAHNNKVRKKGTRTPAEIYQDIRTRRVNPRLLDMLLLEAKRVKVGKEGIHYRREQFSNPRKLHKYIGRSVLVRGRPTYERNNFVEVFADGKHICTAYNFRRLTAVEVVDAKKDQKREIGQEIGGAKKAYAKVLETVGPRYPIDESLKPLSTRNPHNKKVTRRKSTAKGKAIAQQMLKKNAQSRTNK